jgi:hypothetical protein
VPDSLSLTHTHSLTCSCTRFNRHGDCDGDASDVNFIILHPDEYDYDDEYGDLNEHESRVFGSIHVGAHICQIGPNPTTGTSEIRCQPDQNFVPNAVDHYHDLHAPPATAAASSTTNHNARKTSALHFGYSPLPSRQTVRSSHLRAGTSNSHRDLYDDSGSTVDLLVVWTTAAECRASGMDNASSCTLSAATRRTIMGAIQLAVSETNTAFVESGVQTQLRLVHAYREANYVESTTSKPGFRDDLFRLQNPSDGYLDRVHTIRALYGADMVSMIAGTRKNVSARANA